ncbi:MAG: hypothetical protein KAT69_06360 [Candidatus Aminicenantes bacterium]|nr:hypothetical protein [Candidatus Aminicenantes bacterium]
MAMTAKQAVEMNLLKTKWEADQARQKEAQEKLDIYMDDFKEIVERKISELFHPDTVKRLRYHVNQSQNILKRVINEISTIYKGEAQRALDPESVRYDEIKKLNNLDIIGKKVNRYTNLLNETLVKVGFRDGRIAYDIITPNICTVIQNEQDPTKADAIIYTVTQANTRGSTKIRYHYWSLDGDYLIFDESFRIVGKIYDSDDRTGELRPYPYIDPDTKRYILPFVISHKQAPDSAFWDQDSGRDLYNAAIMTAIKMTLFDYYFKVGSFKQIYLIGDESDMPGDQVLDPLTVLRGTGEGAAIGVLDREVNMKQLQEAIIFQLNSIINNYGISADQWTLSIAEMSGIALRIRNMPLMEIREDQIPFYRQFERDLFKVTRIVNNAHLVGKAQVIPEKAEFSVDFAEIVFPEDPIAALKHSTEQLKAGLISLGQFYMIFNPDEKDEKAAEKRIIDNLSKIQEARKKYPDLDQLLMAIVGIAEEEPGGEGAPAAGGGE